MINRTRIPTLFVPAFLSLFCCYLSFAQVSVLTQHNDNARTGQNLSETLLTTSNVNVPHFGKIFWRTVDGYIYAQPLYVPGLSIGGRTRNVVFVATEHNSVYAFDADDPNLAAPLWHVNLGTPVPSEDVCLAVSNCPYDDLQPEIGITSTPVIDQAGNAMYVVTHTKDTSNATYHFWLHKLNLTTGGDILPPAEITTSSPNDTFKPLFQLNRPGLLLSPSGAVVYLAFGSAGDFGDWHGWVMAYDTATLGQLHVYDSTPANTQFLIDEQGGGGIFSCGQGLVTDGTYIYFFTSNGPFDANTGGQDYSDSAIKLRAADLSFVDYFTPDTASYMGQNNVDLGAGGPLLIPGTNPGLLVGGGKDGILRVVNTNSMGGFNSAFNNDVQEWPATGAWIMGSPVYWNSPTLGPVIYLWASGDVAKAWKFDPSTGTFQPPSTPAPVSSGSITSPSGESDTSPLSISANGQQEGILWAANSMAGDPNKLATPGILRAIDANNLGNVLWDSQQNAARDGVGIFAKFNPPTVADGKVYLGTFSGQLLVYGLNPPASSDIAFVQANGNALTTSSSQISATYSPSQKAGDLNVVVVSWADTTSQIQSVTDNNRNTYSLAVAPQSSTTVTQAIYYAKNIAGGNNNTVTVTFKQAASLPSIRILEYSGADKTNPLDVAASNAGASSSGSSVTADSGSAVTRFPNELIFGADTDSKATVWPGAPFVARVNIASDVAADHMVNLTGSYSASAAVSPSSNWVMQMATFKAAVQPTTQPPPPPGFGVAASPGTATVGAGATASYAITISSQNGFSGSVSLVCSGAPSGSQCSLNPASVAAGGTATLTVTTSGPSAQLGTIPGNRAPFYALWIFLPGIALAGGGWKVNSRRRRVVTLFVATGILALVAFQLGCGGGASSSSPPPPPTGGTPAGTYTITVTGTSGNLQASTPVTLVVQ